MSLCFTLKKRLSQMDSKRKTQCCKMLRWWVSADIQHRGRVRQMSQNRFCLFTEGVIIHACSSRTVLLKLWKSYSCSALIIRGKRSWSTSKDLTVRKLFSSNLHKRWAAVSGDVNITGQKSKKSTKLTKRHAVTKPELLFRTPLIVS